MNNSILDARKTHNYNRTEEIYNVDLMSRYLTAEVQPDAEAHTHLVETDVWYAERDLAVLRRALLLDEAV